MKNILLATTALVMTAGFASAEVTFSGSTGVALIDDNGASVYVAAVTSAQGTAGGADDTAAVAGVARTTRDGMFFESYYDFNITASAESDNGISVSAGFDMGSGNMIDYNDDDKLEAQGNSVGDADVAVSYGGWTVTVDNAGLDNLFDDTDGAHDAKLSGTVAGWSVAMTTDQSASHSSYKASGTVAGVALTLTGTNNDDNGGSASKIAASYAVGNGLTLKGSMEDESLSTGAEDDNTLGLSYVMGEITVGYTTIQPGNGDFGDEWDFSVKYAAGPVAASFATDETDATTIILDYSLGGGASAFAAMHDKAGTDNDLTAMGLNFAF